MLDCVCLFLGWMCSVEVFVSTVGLYVSIVGLDVFRRSVCVYC